MRRLKLLFAAAALMLGVGSASAQGTWTAPVVPGGDPATLASNSTVLYIYNVKADAFVNYGMNWATNAIASGLLSGDQTASSRHRATLVAADGKYKLVLSDKSDKSIFCGGGETNDVWTDNTYNNLWTIAETSSTNVYELYNSAHEGLKLDVSYLYGGHLTFANGAGNTEWAFIPETSVTDGSYAKYKEKKDMYAIYQELASTSKTSTYASALETANAVYANASATVADLRAATRALLIAVADGIENPVPASSLFTNANMVGNWTTDGWNVSSAPTKRDADLEKFHSANYSVNQSKDDVPNGLYDIIFRGLYRQDGSGPAPTLTATGASAVSANVPNMKDLASAWGCSNGGWVSPGIPNDMLTCSQALTYEGARAYLNNVRVTGNSLAINMTMTDGSQWLNFYGFEIIYNGALNVALYKKVVAAKAEAEGMVSSPMNATVLSNLQAAISAANGVTSNSSEEALNTVLDALNVANDNAEASIAVYSAINSAISNYATKANALDASGQAAYDASAIQSKYNNGTYATLSEAESDLAAAFTAAVKAQTTEGSDWTALIINPSFENNFTGWTNNGMALQNNTSFGKDGSYYCEAWQPNGTKSVKQTITLPAGVYSISAKSKARGVTSAKIFANGIETSITVSDTENTYNVQFACDNNAEVELGFEGVGTGAGNSWLCVDNFHMTLVSAGLPDVVAVEGKMNADVASAQTEAINTYNNNKTIANYNAAQAAIANAQTSIEAYTRALSAIESANALKEAHNFASAAATTTFAEAIAAIQAGYDECTLTNDQAIAALATLGLTVTGWHAGNDSPAAVYMRDGFSLGNFDKALYINTWFIEGAGDGSNFVVPFYEYWTSDANSLSNNTWTGTLNDIPNGLYTISAWVRVRAKNETAATDATGITMDVNGGGEGDYAAVDVTEGAQIGTTQFTIGTFTAQGIVNRGKLTLNFNISDANISWLSIKNIKYTKVRDLTPEEALIIATDEDYAALNLAINNAEGKTLGFEVNEYAPYNNTAAIALLAAAKAINQNVENVQKDVQAATTALNDATWTVNTEELNAFYDGDFSECAEDNTSPLDYTPAGWTPSGNMRVMLKNTETYPGLVDASAKSAMMSWSGGITYGETTGYTMPLKANTIYKLTFKAAGWNDETRSGITVSVLNTEDGMAAQNLGTPDRDIKAAQTWNTAGMTSYEVLFVTGAAGNYVFHVQSGNNMVLTDFEIKKAASQVLEFADGSVPTYAPGTYPTVKISRTLTGDKWATAIYPFALSDEDVDIVVLDDYFVDDDEVRFEPADNSVDNKPFLMRSHDTIDEIVLKNVVVAAAVADNDVKDVLSFIGVYKETEVGRGENVKNFVLKDNTIYRVGDNAATINPYRAYFQVDQPGEEARLKFFINGQQTTDIEGLKAEKSLNGVIYNLNGQRIEKANKGLYISNGKKVVLK
ncbi:MAG: hypothetical protein IKO17_05390 [Prevotella sp.]|nr:hypothetical protein [Prevotella sp.]